MMPRTRAIVLTVALLGLVAGVWHLLNLHHKARPTRLNAPTAPPDWQATLRRAEEAVLRNSHDPAATALAARAAVELADWRRALHHLAQSPDPDPQILWRAGEGLAIEREWLLAAAVLERLHALSPDRLDVLRRLATAEWYLGRYPSVRRLGERLARERDQRACGFLLVADVAYRRAEHATAADHYRRALEIDPDGHSLLTPLALVYLRFSRSLAALGRLEEAQTSAEQAQHLAPSAASEHWCGELLHRSGEDDRAYSRWCLALERDASYYPAAVSLGKLAFDRKQPEEAIGWLELAAVHELESDRPAQRLIEEISAHLPLPFQASRRESGTVAPNALHFVPGADIVLRDVVNPPAPTSGESEARPLLPMPMTLRGRFAQARAAAQAQNWKAAAAILEELLERLPDHPVLVKQLSAIHNHQY